MNFNDKLWGDQVIRQRRPMGWTVFDVINFSGTLTLPRDLSYTHVYTFNLFHVFGISFCPYEYLQEIMGAYVVWKRWKLFGIPEAAALQPKYSFKLKRVVNKMFLYKRDFCTYIFVKLKNRLLSKNLKFGETNFNLNWIKVSNWITIIFCTGNFIRRKFMKRNRDGR